MGQISSHLKAAKCQGYTTTTQNK